MLRCIGSLIHVLGFVLALAMDLNETLLLDTVQKPSYVDLQRSGIGSQIHVLGLVLAVAMDLDRILLLDTDVHDALFTDDAYCGEPNPKPFHTPPLRRPAAGRPHCTAGYCRKEASCTAPRTQTMCTAVCLACSGFALTCVWAP